MSSLKQRFEKWKKDRSPRQKFGDIFFWVLLLLLLIPGPRKVISTTLNRAVLLIKTPGTLAEDKQVQLSPEDLDWTLVDSEGSVVRLEDLGGQAVFLNFWATWCPPCVAELPEIQKAYEKHWENVHFLLVTNQEPEEVEAFMNRHGYKLPVVYPASPLPAGLQHRALPTTFIISPEGRIVVRKTGAVNWDSKQTDRIFRSLLR
jgi:thiol-disulfide isomerase/thioredoxin